MVEFARRTNLRLIQMRNLNIDPESYLELIPPAQGRHIGNEADAGDFCRRITGCCHRVLYACSTSWDGSSQKAHYLLNELDCNRV